jgi:hypothetical protein
MIRSPNQALETNADSASLRRHRSALTLVEYAIALRTPVKPQPRISIRRIALLTLPFLLFLLIAYAAVQPDPNLTRRGVGILDLPLEYLLVMFLPTYTAAFVVVAVLWLRSRHRQGERLSCSWIAVTRGIGCFVGSGLCLIAGYALATGQVLTGSRLGDAGAIGTLGILLTLPWRVVSVSWIWWSCFVLLSVYFFLPTAFLTWLSYCNLSSTSTQPGPWGWLCGLYAVVAFIGVQVFAVWRVRKKCMRLAVRA